MKKVMRNYGIMVMALLAFTLAFSTVTIANDEDGKNPHTSELKFIGNLENHPVFQLTLNNKEDDEFTISFRDEYGNILYSDKLKGANINKKYMLKAEDLNDAALNVVVKLKNGNKTEIYSISRSSSYVAETVVNKLN